MRDAQSALDQVLAFAGNTIAVEDVSTVLGLVGRDLLFDLLEAIVGEDAPKAFALADRAVESGHDLRLVLRELARLTRDMMIVSVDPSRLNDAEIAETERERLQQLAGRFSREDLMRSFDLLSKAEVEIRSAAQPRYYFEMTLLRWMHLRKLVPLAELLDQMGGASARPSGPVRPGAPAPAPTRQSAPPRAPVAPRSVELEPPKPAEAPKKADAPAGNLKDAFLAEIRGAKSGFYNTVVAQARSIEVTPDRVTFTFSPTHTMLRELFDQQRQWLESTAQRLAGRKVAVTAMQAPAGSTSDVTPADAPARVTSEQAPKRDLKAEAMSSSAVQAMLDVFPGEIRDVEEM